MGDRESRGSFHAWNDMLTRSTARTREFGGPRKVFNVNAFPPSGPHRETSILSLEFLRSLEEQSHHLGLGIFFLQFVYETLWMNEASSFKNFLERTFVMLVCRIVGGVKGSRYFLGFIGNLAHKASFISLQSPNNSSSCSLTQA